MSAPGAYKVCPQCQTATELHAQACPRCGHPFRTQFAPPPNQTQAFYNPQAGQGQVPYPRPQYGPDSNRLLVTILLWFFLGHFGAHRFYLGHTNSAVGMLVLELVGLCTLCILVGYLVLLAVAIWWIIDLIQMLTGNLRPIDGSRLV
ncbi:MAG TPA: NINE protein [Fimbriimonadaceae bacterium]|nr:NINE protein [Fimbriimonadaceae bacterium]